MPPPTRRSSSSSARGNPTFCSDGLLEALADASQRHGWRMQTHLNETQHQAAYGRRLHGKSWVRWLGEIGFLSPRFSGAHGVWLDDGDLEILKGSGAQVVYNPSSNLRLQKRVAVMRCIGDQGGADRTLAPGRFSMMTFWPSFWLSFSIIGRATRSAGPPGGHGLMILMTWTDRRRRRAHRCSRGRRSPRRPQRPDDFGASGSPCEMRLIGILSHDLQLLTIEVDRR
ncbi:MAG: amidohydrolase family protein [Pseudomonadota bacterium]